MAQQTNGFGNKDVWAERSLERSSRELRMLRNVIEKYKDDPKGRAKMMKKMKKYWKSNLSIIEGLDYKPKGDDYVLPSDLAENIEALQDLDPREEETPESVLTEEDMSGIKEMLRKGVDS